MIALHLGVGGKKTDQELDSSELKEMRREPGGGPRGRKQGGPNPVFANGFSSFPNGGPVLNSVVNLWGFCWGV